MTRRHTTEAVPSNWIPIVPKLNASIFCRLEIAALVDEELAKFAKVKWGSIVGVNGQEMAMKFLSKRSP